MMRVCLLEGFPGVQIASCAPGGEWGHHREWDSARGRFSNEISLSISMSFSVTDFRCCASNFWWISLLPWLSITTSSPFLLADPDVAISSAKDTCQVTHQLWPTHGPEPGLHWQAVSR